MICRYFEWIRTIQLVIQTWKTKLEQEEVDYDEIVMYASCHTELLRLCEVLCSSTLIIKFEEVEGLKNSYLTNFELLNLCLIKYIPQHPDAKWCSFLALLEEYGVLLPQQLLTKIEKYVIFPNDTSKTTDQLPIPLATSGLFQPGSDVSLRLSRDFSLKELSALIIEIQEFQNPLLVYLDMLVYFKLNHSVMFDKYLKAEIDSILALSSTDFSMLEVADATHHALKPKVSLTMLSTALEKTKQILVQVIKGEATYADITFNGKIDIRSVHWKRELEILKKYFYFVDHLHGSHDDLDITLNLLTMAQNIYHVYDQYQSRNKLQDEELLRVRTLLMNETVFHYSELSSQVMELQQQLQAAEQRAVDAECREQLTQQRLTECQQHLTSANKSKDALTLEVAALTKNLEGRSKELEAHNTEVWRIPSRYVSTVKPIGSGAWGEVLEGNVSVAMKRLHPTIHNHHNLEKLQREVKLLAEVRHPNLVQFIGAVLDQSPPIIVTELLDMNLRQAYEQTRLRTGDRLVIFIDIVRALDYLHQRYEPIIHRDVSAPNVLLERMPNNQWKGKVSDLGSANFLQNAQTMGEGALVYSPPEVIPLPSDMLVEAEPQKQTVKIDVYSYGVLLCEVYTNRFPKVDHRRDMMLQVQKDHPQLYELIVHCTKGHPSDRPTMAEVLIELNKMPTF